SRAAAQALWSRPQARSAPRQHRRTSCRTPGPMPASVALLSPWTRSGLDGVAAIADGKALELAALAICRPLADSAGNLTQCVRCLDGPAEKAAHPRDIPCLVAVGRQLGTHSELQEPEVGRKSGASELGVGLLEGPKPRKCARFLRFLEARKGAALPRRAIGLG